MTLPLAGRTVVITGDVGELSRADAQAAAKALGAHVTAGITKSTDLLVTGVGAGVSKLSKARVAGIPVVDEAVFRALVADPASWDGEPVGAPLPRSEPATASDAKTVTASEPALETGPLTPERIEEFKAQLARKLRPTPWSPGEPHRTAMSSFTRKGAWTVITSCRCGWREEFPARAPATLAEAEHLTLNDELSLGETQATPWPQPTIASIIAAREALGDAPDAPELADSEAPF